MLLSVLLHRSLAFLPLVQLAPLALLALVLPFLVVI
jgi:hypothetical protein